MEHPTSQQLLALIKNDLSNDEQTNLTNHLAQCPTCRQAYQDINQLRRGWQPDAFASPAADVTQKLTDAFRQKQTRLTDRARRTAALAFDSWLSPAMANLRGQLPPRQILLSEGAVDIDLQVVHQSPEHGFDLQGQILVADGAADTNLAGLQVRWQAKDGETWWGVTDSNGRFSFLQLDYGTYHFHLLLNDQDIVFENLDIVAS